MGSRREVLAVYYIPGMGHGGVACDDLIPAQIDALEAWIDHRQSGGKVGAPAPERMRRTGRPGWRLA